MAYTIVSGYLETATKKNVIPLAEIAADPVGDACKIGNPYDLEPEMLEAYQGTATVTAEPLYDECGTFYTAYAPIYNSSNQVVGLMAVDCEVFKIQKTSKCINV
ncbi:cytochrome P450 family protein [Cellulosilyticum ruminicola]|uniref:hypothetical protein n=1 Tax=Cellulosilyticum ruminicola TaxID=425254 RepID=UPI0006CF85E3|nr:hypothetical protein [Cellulosilyticum ruminicola]